MTEENDAPITTIEFNSDPSWWDMERSGEKPFTVRRWDFTDERCKKLYEWFYQGHYKLAVKIINTKTGQYFTRSVKGVDFMRRAPHWMIVHLGKLTEEGIEEEVMPRMKI